MTYSVRTLNILVLPSLDCALQETERTPMFALSTQKNVHRIETRNVSWLIVFA